MQSVPLQCLCGDQVLHTCNQVLHSCRHLSVAHCSPAGHPSCMQTVEPQDLRDHSRFAPSGWQETFRQVNKSASAFLAVLGRSHVARVTETAVNNRTTLMSIAFNNNKAFLMQNLQDANMNVFMSCR